MESNKLWGWAKLQKGKGKLALDALGHSAIAIGGALALIPLAAWRRWRLWVCVAIGAGAGTGVLMVREGIQLARTGSPHLFDRGLDILPGLVAGAMGGLCVYFIASWLRQRFSR